MRHILTIVLFVVLPISARAQQSEMQMTMPAQKPVALLPGLGTLHHPVSTKNQEAQRYFDQGLRMTFGFNHEEAIRSFQRAAELDPQMAMAWWGVAYALGPNINVDVDPEREKAAYDAVQKAISLSDDGPANERAYIEALATRYSNDAAADLKKLAGNYKNAMGELAKKYPDDLDAATLYAESAMDLRPWQLWSSDGKPAEGTEEIVATLESVLHRNPNHPGAIHYYIHAIEASPHPERALPYAPKLSQLMPMAGHLVHMPAHIYERVGKFSAAAASNVAAVAADEAYFKAMGAPRIYSMLYAHNLDFLAVARSMQGRYGEAIATSDKLIAFAEPVVKQMPMFEPIMAKSLLMRIRFNKWDEIMKQPRPETSLPVTTTIWHLARGLAYAARGDVEGARIEQTALQRMIQSIPPDSMFGLNQTTNVLKVADNVLAARIAEADHDYAGALAFYSSAVAAEDALAYDEPPAWFQPTREMLGGYHLRRASFAAAEKVFRADLEKNPGNGRSLFGLMESLKAQGKDRAAAVARRRFAAAWKNADSKLTVGEL
jgi:tetratricopeptide (TPR) repeat protein